MLHKNRLRVLLLSTVALVPGVGAHAQPSLPTGGAFVAGAGTIGQSGTAMTINQTSGRGVIDWKSFDVGAGHSVRIDNGSGATLNRVTGGSLSSILGRLEASGSLYLVNPQGVVVGETGVVVTGGSFVASTLDVLNEHFMAGGSLLFKGEAPGSVTNLGSISSTGGDVLLIARSVTNAGSLDAPQGTAALAAGTEVLLSEAGGGERVFVRAGTGTRAENSGLIAAAQAELKAAGGNIYALAGNNGGMIRATGTRTRAGRVWLSAEGGDVTLSGGITARDADGSGGGVTVNATGGTVLHQGGIDARGVGPATDGGKGGGRDGGTVIVTGERVGLAPGSRIDASGTGKGGTVLVGGDRYGGRDVALKIVPPPIPNAKRVAMAAEAAIRADGGTGGGTGAGGSVVVWSDGTTTAAGAITAKGGAAGGDGGFVEVSGKGNLAFAASVDTSAPQGRTGTLLLDPTDIMITSGPGNAPSGMAGGDPTIWGGGMPGGDAMEDVGLQPITTGAIRDLLGSNSIILEASGGITWQTGATLNIGGLTGAMNRKLTLRAGNAILFGGKIGNLDGAATDKLSVVFNSDRDGDGIGNVAFLPGSKVNTNGGSIEVAGGYQELNGYLVQAAFSTSSAPSGIAVDGAELLSNGGDIRLTGGVMAGASSNVSGVSVTNGAMIDAGTGTIRISGTGADLAGMTVGSGSNGIRISDASITSSNRTSSAVSIFGTGGTGGVGAAPASFTQSSGVLMTGTASIRATGDGGWIDLVGTGGGPMNGFAPVPGSDNHGVALYGQSRVVSTGGSINLGGTRGFAGTGGTRSQGVLLADSAGIGSVSSDVMSGTIAISADGMSLGGAGLSTTGDIALMPSTPGRAITLGTDEKTVTALEFSGSELSGLTARSLLIGGPDAGVINMAGPVSLPNIGALRLKTGGGITQEPSSQSSGLSVAKLAITSGGDVVMNGDSNMIGMLAVKTTGADVGFRNNGSFEIGQVEELRGINVGTGRVVLSVTGGATPTAITQGAVIKADVLGLNAPDTDVVLSRTDNLVGRLTGSVKGLSFGLGGTTAIGYADIHVTGLNAGILNLMDMTRGLKATAAVTFDNAGTLVSTNRSAIQAPSIQINGSGGVGDGASNPLVIGGANYSTPARLTLFSTTDNASYHIRAQEELVVEGVLSGSNTTLDLTSNSTLRIGQGGLSNLGANSLTSLHDLYSPATIRQDGALLADRLRLETFANIALTNPGNRIGTLEGVGHAATGTRIGNVEIVDGADGLILSGDIGGALFRTINIRTTGDLTLSAGTTVVANAPAGRDNPNNTDDVANPVRPGGQVVLSATGNVINNAGASAVQADRQWLIYAADSTRAVKGGLVGGDFYGATYATKDPSTVTEAALYIFADQSTVPPPVTPPVEPPVTPPAVVSPPPPPPVVEPPVTPPVVVSPPPLPPVVEPPVSPPVLVSPQPLPPVVEPRPLTPPVAAPPVVVPPVIGGTASVGSLPGSTAPGSGTIAGTPWVGSIGGVAPPGAPSPDAAPGGRIEASVDAGGFKVVYSQPASHSVTMPGTGAGAGPGMTGGGAALGGASSFTTFKSDEHPDMSIVSSGEHADGSGRSPSGRRQETSAP